MCIRDSAIDLAACVDDAKLAAGGPARFRALLAAFLVLMLLGVPLSWKKVRGGVGYVFVGYAGSVRDWTLGMAATRVDWIVARSKELAAGQPIQPRFLKEFLGMCAFAAGALPHVKPFLGRLYAWAAAHPLHSAPRSPYSAASRRA
eukprot:14273696-Alexandrium_andersonii.AAC.1